MEQETKKRKDECQFCKSRRCHKQIYRLEAPLYDEVYCNKHCNEAEKACDEVLGKKNGVMRTYRSSTGNLIRGKY